MRPAEFEPRFVLAHRLCFSSSRQLASVTCFVTFAGAVRAACQKRQNFARRQKTTGAAVVFYTPARRARHKKSSRKGGFFMLRVRPGAGSRGRNELAPGIRGIMTGIKTGGARNLKGFGMPGGGNEPCNADSVECGQAFVCGKMR